MYLSQLILNPRSRQVRSEMSNPYEMHRTLMRAFPATENGGPGRVLFRLENHLRTETGGLTLLVQSEQAPNWSWLDGLGPYLLSISHDNPAIKRFNPTFTTGQRLLFRLRANPTVKRQGKRRGLYREEEQRAWLNRKAEQGGFAVLAVDIVSEGLVRGKIQHAGQESHSLRFLAVRFDGLLQVIDPAQLLDTLQQGIGSGKGLGFGLLSVAKGT